MKIKEYGQLMREKYKELMPLTIPGEAKKTKADIDRITQAHEDQKLKKMMSETYCASVFLPCHHDHTKNENASGNKVEVLVAHQDLVNIDMLTIAEIP